VIDGVGELPEVSYSFQRVAVWHGYAHRHAEVLGCDESASSRNRGTVVQRTLADSRSPNFPSSDRRISTLTDFSG